MSSLKNSFFRHVAQTSPEPDGFEVVRGDGIYLLDCEGKYFIDCISGIAVSTLGHNHPRIISAIQQQLTIHLHTHVYGEHIIEPQVRLAEKLASTLPTNLSTTYFVNSGAEAVEGALKLAKKYTGRYEVISCKNAYHGSTAGADSLRSDSEHTASSRPLVPGIKHIRFNLLEDLETINDHTACVIIEPIQGEAGVIVPTKGYLAAVRKRCNETGSLLIFDEIQTGMGRSGDLWAFEEKNVIPDILLLAKGFGGGLPLGAFISSEKIMHALSDDPPLGHMTTFGGNALCCAASLEALNIITENKLYLNAKKQGNAFISTLSLHPAVKEVRGRGLMLAIELHDPSQLKPSIKACREQGLLVDWFLFNDRSIRVAPPLILTDTETKSICEKFIAALDSL
jgi:acetylornithine/N-succinyldiaminopimelate aminotransferase